MLTLADAAQIVEQALAHARSQGLAPMTVAVLDVRGCVVALKMEDGSSLLRPDIASGKAWSALAMGFGTRNLEARARSLPSFFGALACLADGRVLPVPGGCWSARRTGRCWARWARAVTSRTTTRPAPWPGSRR